MRTPLLLAAALLAVALHTASASAKDAFPETTVPESLAVTFNFGYPGAYPGGNDANFAKLSAAGFRLVRFLPDWQLIERKKGVYDFAYTDQIMASLAGNNLRPIITLGISNSLYGAYYRIRGQDQQVAFGNFVRAITERYKGRHVIWEIWNEPNIAAFWRPTAGAKLTTETSLLEYLQMVKVIVPIIRARDPEALVIGPAAANYNTMWLYLGLKTYGLLTLFDGVSVHPYQPGNIPEQIIRQHAQVQTWIPGTQKGKALLFSELGYSAGQGKNEVNPAVQGAYLQREYLLSLMLGARLNAFYSMTDTDANEPCVLADHCYGFFTRYSGQEKPSLAAIARVVEMLRGYGFSKRIPQTLDSTFVLEFTVPDGSSRYAVWDSLTPSAVNAVLPTGKAVAASYAPTIYSGQ